MSPKTNSTKNDTLENVNANAKNNNPSPSPKVLEIEL
jgi:hypothetical protein